MHRPLVTLCMIARDEASILGRCLDAAAPYVDDIVLVDTGSTDGTADLAAARGALVAREPWRDDFSAARNAALERATGRYVLVLDADEWIASGPSPEEFRDRLRRSDEEALTVLVDDRLDGGASRRYPLVRLFRNRPEHRYAGSVHEQITPAIARRLGRALVEPPASGLVVAHDGYQRARRIERGKAERNLTMLRRAVADAAEPAAQRYFLARELVPLVGGRAVPGLHLVEGIDHLNVLALDAGALPPALAADAARLHAAALLAAGRPLEAAAALERRGDRGVACDLLRADAALACAAGNPEAAGEALRLVTGCFDRATGEGEWCIEPSLAGAIARARAAEALLVLARVAEARAMVEAAARLPGGGAAPSIARAAIERSLGDWAAALRAYAAGLDADPLDPWAWAGAGEVLLEAGRPADALPPLRQAALIAPGWDRVDEALGAALLLVGRPEDARDQFASGPGASGPGAQAALFLAGAVLGSGAPLARLHQDAPDSARRILGRVASAGRPDLLQRLASGLSALRAQGA